MLRRALAAVVTVVAMQGLATATELAGVPHIISGNAVAIGKTRLWLAGVGAPGLEQVCLDASGARWTCGVAARDELAKHVGNSPWTCQTEHRDSSERLVGICSVGGEDVGKWMIANGWAIAGAHASKDYEAAEGEAKAGKAGLWAGAFIAPREWHRRNAQAPKLGALDISPTARATLLHGHFGSTPPSPDCAIKGHVNRSGTCIYHMPGGRWYARVSIEPDNGDRWFCSKEEAELASCRETKR
ncbi:MAG: thermonuclease family protein [Xanthobacteraceae bacterium]|nr:thermonuclease family protein [Xanthobacteraceae bacterium]